MSASPPKATEILCHGKRRLGQTYRLVRGILPCITASMSPLGTGRIAIGIGRRQFIRLGGAVINWPLAAHAQRPTLPFVGYLHIVEFRGRMYHGSIRPWLERGWSYRRP